LSSSTACYVGDKVDLDVGWQRRVGTVEGQFRLGCSSLWCLDMVSVKVFVWSMSQLYQFYLGFLLINQPLSS
jgi:hypothetical protein